MQSPSGPATVRLMMGTLILATLAMALVQPVEAQAAAPTGVLYFTNTAVGDNGNPAGGCPSLPVYEMSQVVPAEEGQADMGLSAVAQACSTDFQYTATSDFTLGASGSVHVTLDCLTPAPMIAIRFDLLKNDEQISTVQTALAPDVCVPMAQPIEFNTTVDTANTAFAIGDTFVIQVIPFWLSPLDGTAQATSGVVVGGANPSAVYAPGLPAAAGTPQPDNPNDTDGDGLNDTCEQQYFGNLTAENATGDADGDGLSNAEECNNGTDPTNPDSDGDGTNDKDDPSPNDASQGGTSTTTTSSTNSSTAPSTSSSTSASPTSSSTTNGGGDSDDSPGTCADGDTSDAVDCLESDVGYLGMSAGGFLAVLILCIVALATRWSL